MSQLMTLPTPAMQEDFSEFIFSELLRSLLQKRAEISAGTDATKEAERLADQQQQAAHKTHALVGQAGYRPGLAPARATQNSTDADLVEQAAAGNERAFELLVQRYEAQVSHFVHHHIAYTEDVQDIVQFVFLQLYLFLPRLRGHLVSTRSQQPLKSWLLQVAMNRCRDERRKKHPLLFSELERASEEEADPLDYIPDTAPLPEEFAEAHDRQRRLQDAIQGLPPKFRAIVSLRYQEDLTFREIGNRLHIPENTAKTYFQRARPLLRTALALV
jgi:RNA polymerase sigma-70 factor (ECF subfamily)